MQANACVEGCNKFDRTVSLELLKPHVAIRAAGPRMPVSVPNGGDDVLGGL